MKRTLMLTLLFCMLLTGLSVDKQAYAVGEPILINATEQLTITTPSASYTLLNPTQTSYFPALEAGEYTLRSGTQEERILVANAQPIFLTTSRGVQVILALNLPNGKQISPPGFSKMLFTNLDTDEVRITPDLKPSWDFVKTYSVDPTNEGFGAVDITRVAQGNSLYKCVEYDYFNERCTGNWVFYQSITPGQEYTITVTGADPVFGEGESGSSPVACRLWDQAGTSKGSVNENCLSGVEESGDSLFASIDDIEDGGNSELQIDFTNDRSIAAVNELTVSYRWQRLPVSGGGSSVGATTATIQAFISGGWTTACTTTVPVNTWGTYVCDFSSILTNPAQANDLQTRVLFSTARAGRPNDEARVLVDYTFMALDYDYLDIIVPTYEAMSVSPTTPRPYAPNNSVFSIDWEDDAGIDTVLIEHNFTGTFVNETMTGGPGTYTYTRELPAGVYAWRSIANDTSGNINQTLQQSYVVNKASGAVELTLNGSQDNIQIIEGESVLAVGTRVAGEGDLFLYQNDTLLAQGTSISELLSYPNKGTYVLTLNKSESQNYTAATQTWTVTVIDVTPPASVTNIDNVSSDETWIYWTWNNPVDVDFLHVIVELNGTFIANTTDAFINTTSLLSGGLYELQLRTVDDSGNINESVQTALGTTQISTDTTPPHIENVTATNLSDSAVTITWDTNEPASSRVKYGTTSGVYTQESFSSSQVHNHARTLTGLSPSTTYYYVVNSTDPAGNSNESSEYSFTTLADTTPPHYSAISSSPAIGAVYPVTATFNVSWTDNTAVDTVLIEHNFTGTWTNQTMTGGPQYTFSYELAAGVYAWRSIANDTLGNANEGMGYQTYTVNKATGALQLFLNGMQASTSADQDTTVNLTAAATAGEGVIELLENGVVLSQQFLSTTTLKSYTTPGTYTITARLNASQNYTSASQNYTLTINDAQPPDITLIEPFDGETSTLASVTFSYQPSDNVATTQCRLLINGSVQTSSSTITDDATNTFATSLSDGSYLWNVECEDAQGNTATATNNRTLNVAIIHPWIPTTATFSGGGTITATVDESDNTVQQLSAGQYVQVSAWSESAPSNANISQVLAYCEVDAAVNSAYNAFQYNTGSGWSGDVCAAGAGQTGLATCNLFALGVDTIAELNALQTRCIARRPGGGPPGRVDIDYVYVQPDWTLIEAPDFVITDANITLPAAAQEGQLVQLNATVANQGDVGATALVRFIDETRNTIIGQQSLTISQGQTREFSVTWQAEIGHTQVRVVVDPNNIISELDETNNEATGTIDVDAWQTYYGTLVQRLRILADSTAQTYDWNVASLEGNILAVDADATTNFLNLQALTRSTTNTYRFEDLAAADAALNMTGFVDSINATFSDGATGLLGTTTFTVFGQPITDVPIIETSGPFTTGILWDVDADTNGFYDGEEPLVFVTRINLTQTGQFGTSDYELFVPALLRENVAGDTGVTLYLELT